ncbi:FGGY-family carbohydrate kinase [Telmatobacter sp. DSM 110680]|uniref:FGGY-family carbohydrate kinase n=1 Tax=Telmatobacter sp. DSM 110680 TaxID=3036704 RepID=A0AAU7DE42_9BACT
MNEQNGRFPEDSRARVAIDLGAESCRVSLLRWRDGLPHIAEVHRISNGPVEDGESLKWPLGGILAGIEGGLRRAAVEAPEGIASIAVDGWAVDYVRLDSKGQPLHDAFCYRDQRTVAAKQKVDSMVAPEETFRRTGAQPLRINTMYQLFADDEEIADAPWLCLPEYVLHWLGAPPVAEYTNATHTGLIDFATGDWAYDLFARLSLSVNAAPRVVAPGTRLGRLKGPLTELEAFRDTELIAPACHDTASAIAGIPVDLDSTAYICSGTWSLVGTVVSIPIATPEAMAARYTNQGAATGGFCFHTNVNGMWLLRQCMESWASEGRSLTIPGLVQEAASCECAGIINVDADPLLLSGDMPGRINRELAATGSQTVPETPGNEALFARVIFESLATRYATALADLEQMLDRKMSRIHIIGGASRNQLLADLTSQRTGIPVECGHPESSTIGNFAVQVAASESPTRPATRFEVRQWAGRLCSCLPEPCIR